MFTIKVSVRIFEKGLTDYMGRDKMRLGTSLVNRLVTEKVEILDTQEYSWLNMFGIELCRSTQSLHSSYDSGKGVE